MYRARIVRICFVSWIWVVVSMNPLNCFSQTGIADAITLLEVNHQAIDSYDVIIKMSSVKDEGEVSNFREEVVRQIFDAENKRCTILRFGSEETSTSRNLTPSLESGLISACVIKDSEAASRSWPGRTQNQKSNSFADARLAGESVSFEFVGFMPFPVSRTAMLSKSGDENVFADSTQFWTTIRSQWRNGKQIETSQDQSVFRCEGRNNVLLELAIDERSLLPRRFSALGRKANGEYRRIQNEFVDWQSLNGVYVPSRISRDRLHGVRENGVMKANESSEDFEFDWVSINEQLSDRLFDSSILNDSQNVMRLLKLREGNSKK